MPVLQRKRRAAAEATESPQPRRRRRSGSDGDSDASMDADDPEGEGGDEDAGNNVTSGVHEQMVKKLVRLAVASEYSRQPLRRADISAKVLAPNNSRNVFKAVFDDAQKALQTTFGMQLSELPLKEKVTVAQKRAARGANTAASSAASAAASSKAYILTSALPMAFRGPAVLPPSRVPDVQTEAAYDGFVGFIVALIYLSEGQRLSEGKLLRHLRACNADELVLNGEKTETILKKLERQGYIVKIKERDGAGGEENIEYVVGPRGKLEIGPKGVAGLVRNVYGKRDTELEELEDRLEASLGTGAFRRRTRPDESQESQQGVAERTTQNAESQPPASRAQSSQAAPGRRESARTRGGARSAATYGQRQTRRTRNAAEEEDDDGQEEDEEDDNE